MAMSALPVFHTDRLVLREVGRSDIPSYQKYFSDYEVIRHLARHVPWPYPDNGVEIFLETMIFPNQGKDQWMWGLFEKENPANLIGCVHLWRKGRPENRGFWLARPFWGKGYMTEAVWPVMNYAFDELGFDTLIFANAVGNSRSRRVKEKTGAKLLRVEAAQFVDPTLTHHEIWELKREDWSAHRQYQPGLLKQ